MSNPYRDKLLGIGFMAGGRPSRPKVTEGRAHPESGAAWKATSDESGTVTEHNTRDDRVDHVVRPLSVRAVRTSDGKVKNVNG